MEYRQHRFRKTAAAERKAGCIEMEVRDYLTEPEKRGFADLWQNVKTDRLTICRTGAVIIFPVENPSLTGRLMDGFGQNGKAYDYHAYDRSLDSTWLDARRIGMILMRLKFPVDLSFAREQQLRFRISSQLEKVLRRIAAGDSTEDLELLCEMGFITDENGEACVRIVRDTGKREMMVRLMNWKHAELHAAFDFSL